MLLWFQLQSFIFQYLHVTTLLYSSYIINPSFGNRQRHQDCVKRLAIWSDGLYQKTRHQGREMSSYTLHIILPKGSQPIHRIRSLPTPLCHSANHLPSVHRENWEWRTPLPTGLLYTVQQRWPPRQCQRPGPLGLHSNSWPDTVVRVNRQRHQIQ